MKSNIPPKVVLKDQGCGNEVRIGPCIPLRYIALNTAVLKNLAKINAKHFIPFLQTTPLSALRESHAKMKWNLHPLTLLAGLVMWT